MFLFNYNFINFLVSRNNKKFLSLEYSNSIFDNINNYSLDYKQRKAIILDEDNILVIAGAGSGKTLTIVGKVRYLVEYKKICKNNILCISFTNNSVNDLKISIKKSCNYDIDVYTFHKLSLNILNDSNCRYSISPSDTLDYIIDEIFFNIFYNDDEHNKILINIKKLIKTFINLFKSNNFKIDKFDEIINKNNKVINKDIKNSNFILLNLIKKIYILYDEELKSSGQIDFNDMISLAINNVYNSNINYKYIIIDEYQDTSLLRYELLKKIKDKCNSKVFAVGDDFQSIYRFTGCNLDIFLKFKEYFGKTEIIKIINTYRNSKELIDVAGSFIMKNSKQIFKIMNSSKRLYKPIKIIYYDNLVSIFIKLIEKINTNILVLGRNNKDINPILKSGLFKLEKDKLIYINNKTINIRYLTVHKSKGLEEENVIILNMNDDYLGFPNKILDNKILDYIMILKDKYPYEEERRLFYVALTRTKNYVYLLSKRKTESIFIKELKKIGNKNIQFIN